MTFHYGHLSGRVIGGRVIADGCGCDLGPPERPDASRRQDKPKRGKRDKGRR